MKENCKGKILVIDDEEDVLATLREMLEKDSYEVLEALNGKEGLRRVAKHALTWLSTNPKSTSKNWRKFSGKMYRFPINCSTI